VVYHFWPQRLTGGYVGVDVFFVISGFLITSHLLAKPPRTVPELGRFWGRRVRRLLPASFLVLLATLGASLLWAPSTMWSNIAKQVAASALYVQNWFLAAESVDYLADDNAATPVQHFWSLSVEEQFYIVWPVLIAVALLLAARFGWKHERAVMTSAVGIVVGLSLAASVVLTVTDPAAAYFVSWTRFWELGIGGLVAGLYPMLQRALDRAHVLRPVLLIVGLAAILISALTFVPATPFPGYAALLPVLGTAAVIAAAVDERRWALARPMAWRPVQLLGDVSYSLYLWHWPAVILLPLALDRTLRWPEKLLCIAVLVALSVATKVFVEDRFRGTTSMGNGLKGTFAFMLIGMLVVAGASFAVVRGVAQTESAATSAVESGVADDDCFGARALAQPDQCEPHGDALVTDPAFAATDQPDPYQDGCWILGDFSKQRTCHYGSKSPDAQKVALVGNSHAGHWLPALQQINESTPWSITTYLISECYTVDVPIDFGGAQTENCASWNERVQREIADGDYDLVVLSNRTARPLQGVAPDQQQEAAQAAYARMLNTWAQADVPVLVLKDTPYATELKNVPDCVAQHQDDLGACDGTRAREQPDPQYAAAEQIDDPHVEALDLTSRFCADESCYSTLGGVIVYFDRGHMSATFARTLAPDVLEAADRLRERVG